MKSLTVKFLLILVVLLLVTGCSNFQRLLKSPEKQWTLNPPEDSMTDCDPLKAPKEGDDAGDVAKGWGGQYAVCQLKHEFLVWYIREKQAERGKN